MAASSEPRSRGRADIPTSRGLLLGAALVVLALGVTSTVVRGGGDDPIERARDLVADDGNFATATESGVTFTKVSTALEHAADDCRSTRASGCDDLYAAAGYARVSAVGVLRCTRPGVFDAREAMRSLLDDLDRRGDAAIPAVVSCR